MYKTNATNLRTVNLIPIWSAFVINNEPSETTLMAAAWGRRLLRMEGLNCVLPIAAGAYFLMMHLLTHRIQVFQEIQGFVGTK